jgi:hypothetical protein
MRFRQRPSSWSILAGLESQPKDIFLFGRLTLGHPRERSTVACLRALRGYPGADHHPHGWAGARGGYQDVRRLSSWRAARPRWGANPRPCHGHGSLPNQLDTPLIAGQSNRSLSSLLVRQLHDCLGPSDIFVVREIADGLDI